MQRIENIEEIRVNNTIDYLVIGIKRKNEEDEILKIKKDEVPLRSLTFVYQFRRDIEEKKKAEIFIEFLSVFNLWDKVTFNDFDNLFKEELNGRRDK